jgi:drug/metabolite transporter (DMT)-like permease
VILATIFYAISVNVIRKYLSDLDAISISALAFLFLGPASGIYIYSTDFVSLLFTDGGKTAFIYIVILAVIGTSLAVVIFNKLVKDSSAIFASSVTYLIPIVALLWGVFDGENITIYHLAGVSVILSGVYLVNKKTPTI